LSAGVIITESRPSDVLAALHSSAQAEHEYLFASRDAQPDDLILVAWIDEEAVGYIATTDEPGGAMLVWEHVVVPAHRSQGLGERLLLEAVQRTKPDRAVQMDPLAELDVDRLIDYYRRLGFAWDATRHGLFATAGDVVRAVRRRTSTEPEAKTTVAAIIDTKDPGVITVPLDATVATVIAKLNEHAIGAIVASSGGGRVEGIVSERDVLRGIGAEGPSFLDRTVGSVVTTDVVTCTADDSIATVMDLMTASRVRHIPIVDAGALAGIVSIGDVVLHRLREVESDRS
jgi:CBS domain-containing protein/ribosomal protein S18 acetylase RimI-like enzyme